MARRPGDLAVGGNYHVWCHGIAGRGVFVDDDDRLSCLQCLVEDLRLARAALFAYCIVGNRIHVALRIGDVPLARMFQRTLTAYACRFNRRHAAAGYLFGARLGSRLLRDADDLARLVRTIHHNPVEAGFVDRPEAWRWSSYAWYFDGRLPEALERGGDAVLCPRVAEEETALTHAPVLAELAPRVAMRCGTTLTRLLTPGRTVEGIHARSVLLLAAVDGLGIPIARVAHYLRCPPPAAHKMLVRAREGTALAALAASVLTTCRPAGEPLPAVREESLLAELR